MPLFCSWKTLKLVFMQGKPRCNWKFRYLHCHSSDLRFKNKISSNRVKQQVCEKCEKYTMVRTRQFLEAVGKHLLKMRKASVWDCPRGVPVPLLTRSQRDLHALASHLAACLRATRRVGTWRQHHHHQGAYRACTGQNLSVLPLTSVESGRSFSTMSIQDSVCRRN